MIDLNHIHPMLVHFPLVLYLLAVALQLLVLGRGGDLAALRCLPNAAFGVLVLAAASAAVTAFFGDIALDAAEAKGFPRSPLELHGDLGFSSMWLILTLTAVHLLARWRRWTLGGVRGWGVAGIAVLGVALLLVTAYFGGDLVYGLGVNVGPVTP